MRFRQGSRRFVNLRQPSAGCSDPELIIDISSMPESVETKPRLQRATTAIRPKSLDRLNLVLPYLPKEQPRCDESLRIAADQYSLALIEKHKIPVPPELAFETCE